MGEKKPLYSCVARLQDGGRIQLPAKDRGLWGQALHEGAQYVVRVYEVGL